MKNLVTVIQGIAMGTAEVIPGVSGSTIALIMGIYDDFIDLLHSTSTFVKSLLYFLIRKHTFKDLRNDFKKINLKFGILLGVGMLIAIGGFSHIFTYLLEKFPPYVYAFFFGLIISSVLFPFQRMEKKTIKELIIFILSFIIFFIILGLKPADIGENPNPLYIYFGGMLGISAMVLPGISGSFILLLLGLYNYIIEIVKETTKLNFNTDHLINLAIFAFGIITGFLLFVRILKLALTKANSEVMAFLIGLMLASIRVIWPFIDTSSSTEPELMKKIWPTAMDTKDVTIIILISVVTASITIAVNLNVKKE